MYRPEIDGLRAIAVISVIAYHLGGNLLPSGFLGVDIFFVISGYVITQSLLQNIDKKLGNFLLSFYAKRIKRLLPALITVVLVAAISISLVANRDYIYMTDGTGLRALLGISNIFLYQQSVDYWGGVAQLNLLMHTWSLGVEEQFYFLFPIILWFIFSKKLIKNVDPKYVAIGIFIVLFLTTAMIYWHTSISSPKATFYLAPFRLWELLAGVIIYLFTDIKEAYEEHGKNNKKFFNNLIQLTLVSLMICALNITDEQLSIAARTLLVVILFSCLILSFNHDSKIRSIFSSAPLVYIGKISYSLYLWHWIIISLTKWIFETKELGISGISIQILVIFIISVMSYEFIENKIRYKRFNTSNIKIVVLGLFSIIGSCFTVIFIYLISINIKVKTEWDGIIMVHNNFLCHSPKWSSDPIKDCLIPINESTRHIYVLGDSHATNLIPSISAAMPKNFELKYLGDDIFTGSLINPEDPAEFRKRMEFINKYLKDGDIVFFSMSRDYFFTTDFETKKPRFPGLAGKIFLKTLEDRLSLFAKLIDEKGGKLIIVNGLPKVCSHEEFALQKNLGKKNPCSSKAEESLADRKSLSNVYDAVVEKNKAILVDPHPLLCPYDICSSNLNGKIIYWDASPHTVTSYPDLLKDFFIETVFNNNVGR